MGTNKSFMTHPCSQDQANPQRPWVMPALADRMPKISPTIIAADPMATPSRIVLCQWHARPLRSSKPGHKHKALGHPPKLNSLGVDQQGRIENHVTHATPPFLPPGMRHHHTPDVPIMGHKSFTQTNGFCAVTYSCLFLAVFKVFLFPLVAIPNKKQLSIELLKMITTVSELVDITNNCSYNHSDHELLIVNDNQPIFTTLSHSMMFRNSVHQRVFFQNHRRIICLLHDKPGQKSKFPQFTTTTDQRNQTVCGSESICHPDAVLLPSWSTGAASFPVQNHSLYIGLVGCILKNLYLQIYTGWSFQPLWKY